MVAKRTKQLRTKLYTSKDYEYLGKLLVSIYESGFRSHRRLFAFSFMRGIFFGLGGAIGASIVVGVIIWFLSVLRHVPIIGPVFDSTKHSLEQPN